MNDELKNVSTSNGEQPAGNPFVNYLKGIWIGTVDSFRYNPCKLPGILVLLPGLFIGFFLGIHRQVLFLDSSFHGLYMFIMVLLGCINIFNGVTLMSKRNLGSVIISFLCSLVIAVVGVLWIVAIINSYITAHGPVDIGKEYSLGFNEWTSMICVALSIVCSMAGCILGYIKRDKNYKKVTF